jgi:glycosyltransferase involved in cell wall biosynthesis
MGLPTVTTSLGCEGLSVEDDQHLLVRDQPEDFAKAIVELIADAKKRDRLRQTGRALVEAQYDWEQIWETAVDLMLDRYAKHKGDMQK